MPEFKGQSFDVGVLACKPTRPQDYTGERKRMWNEMAAELASQGVALPPNYPGSFYTPCVECGVEVQVGPKQQEVLDEHPSIKVLCLLDAVFYSMQTTSAESVGVVNLGNDYKERP